MELATSLRFGNILAKSVSLVNVSILVIVNFARVLYHPNRPGRPPRHPEEPGLTRRRTGK